MTLLFILFIIYWVSYIEWDTERYTIYKDSWDLIIQRRRKRYH